MGAGTWTENQLEVAAIGAVALSDFGGPILPGYTSGNTMQLKIWDASESVEYDANYTTSFGSGGFNGLFTNINSVSVDDCASGVYDCAGICDGDAVEDCAGECGGDAVIDECGVCDGSGYNDDGCCGDETTDCAGECLSIIHI